DLGEERDAAEPEVARHLDLASVLHREGDEAVDLRGRDPSVVERRRDRLAGERQLAVLEALAERGLPDADDGGAVLDGLGHGDDVRPITRPGRAQARAS